MTKKVLTALELLERKYQRALEILDADSPYLPMLAAQLRDSRGNRGKSGLDEYFSARPVSFKREDTEVD